MDKIYEISLLGSAAIGIYVSIVLLFFSKQNILLNRLLSLFSATISLLSLMNYCIVRDWSPDFMVLIRTFIPIYYFLPATCYIYYRTYIQDDTHLKKKDLLHLIPIFLNLIYVSPLIYSIFTEKILWRTIVISVDEHFIFHNSGFIPSKFHVFFRHMILLFYIFQIWRLHFSKNYNTFLAKNRKIYPFSIKWINYYIITITVFGISATLRQLQIFYFYDGKNLFNDFLIPFLVLLSFDALITYAIVNPVILFGLPHFKIFFDANSKNIVEKNNDLGLIGRNKPKSKLNANEFIDEMDALSTQNLEKEVQPTGKEETEIIKTNEDNFIGEDHKIQLLIQQINEYIEKYQPYREVEFNILVLSKALNVPQHQILYIFRVIFKKSFVDFRNELRIKYVIESIQKGKLKTLTLDAISKEAGFASRTTFYAVFKKQIGITPGEYVEKME
jgi:AraC-like DNA-binding protein